jgi:hypothetical protein
MGTVRNLCSKSGVFVDGELTKFGNTGNIVSYYFNKLTSLVETHSISSGIKSLPYDSVFKLENVEISQRGIPGNVVLNGLPIDIKIYFHVKKSVTGLRLYIDVNDIDDNILIRTFHDELNSTISKVKPGRYVSQAIIQPDLLAPITYRLHIQATIYNERSCTGRGLYIPLIVESSNKINIGYPNDTIRSKIQPLIKWNTKEFNLPFITD